MNKLKPGSGIYRNRGCGVMFGLIFVLAAAPGLIVSVVKLLHDPEGGWFPAILTILCSAPFVLIGLGIIIASVIPWIAELRIGKPDISISSSSVRVGDGFSVSYSQSFKQKADVKGVKVSLVNRERATYTSGTTSTTVNHEVTADEFDYPGRTFEAGDQLSFSRGMAIPRDGMHTFEAAHNQIAWLLHVKVDIAGWPDYNEYFEITVQPDRA